MAQVLTGKEAAAALNEKTKERVEALKKRGITPLLLIIRVGENPGDIAYERGAAKRCEALGMAVRKTAFPADASGEELLAAIEDANRDDSVHGVLLLRPLPKHMNRERIENALDPAKDVDCMTQASLSAVYTGRQIGFPPCTAQACMEILDYYGISCAGKRAVVVGRSAVVGKPAAMMLLARNATVTICHTGTVDLAAETSRADILLAAAGRAKMIGAAHCRPGQVVLDVGINEDADGKLCGDADFAAVSEIAGAVTPVPGGVGSVTTAVLASHVAEAAERAVTA